MQSYFLEAALAYHGFWTFIYFSTLVGKKHIVRKRDPMKNLFQIQKQFILHCIPLPRRDYDFRKAIILLRLLHKG